MKLLDYSFDTKSRSKSLNLWGLGDFHLGTTACHEQLLKANITKIAKDPNARVIGLGDYGEFINISDPRFDPKILASWLGLDDLNNLAIRQCNHIIEMLLPISDKIIGLAGGNHEEKIITKYHFDPLEYIITRLRDLGNTDIENLGYGISVCRLKLRRRKIAKTLLINIFHGSSGATTSGGAINTLIKDSNNIISDVYLRGHTHQLGFIQQARLHIPVDGKLDIVDKPQILVQCGSYLRSYAKDITTYAEKKRYNPAILGSPEVQIFPKDKAHFNINLHT